MQLNEIPFEGHIIFCVDIMPSSADNERTVSGVMLAGKWRTLDTKRAYSRKIQEADFKYLCLLQL